MAQIDSSIYFQQQAPDFLGNIQKGMSLRDSMDQRALQQKQLKEDEAIRNAYRSNMTTGPNGELKFDRAATLGQIAQVNPQKAMEAQQQFTAQDALALQRKRDQMGMVSSLAMGIKDEPSRQQAFKMALQAGIPQEQLDQLPQFYDASTAPIFKQIGLSASTAQQQIENEAKNRGLDIEQQNANTKAKEAQDKHMDRIAGVKDKADAKAAAASQKAAEALKKDLDADAGRTGNFGTVSRKVMQAQNLETLAKAFPDGNLDSRQIEELSLGLANMLAGSGGTSRAQVEGLIPHTWSGKMANVQEWLTSNPTGAGQQEFVKRMMHTIEREKELSLDQLNSIREQRLTSHQGLAKSDPETYRAILSGYGMNPDNYDNKGLRKAGTKKSEENPKEAITAVDHPEANSAFQWAKKNPNDPRAKEIMQRLGI